MTKILSIVIEYYDYDFQNVDFPPFDINTWQYWAANEIAE